MYRKSLLHAIEYMSVIDRQALEYLKFELCACVRMSVLVVCVFTFAHLWCSNKMNKTIEVNKAINKFCRSINQSVTSIQFMAILCCQRLCTLYTTYVNYPCTITHALNGNQKQQHNRVTFQIRSTMSREVFQNLGKKNVHRVHI